MSYPWILWDNVLAAGAQSASSADDAGLHGAALAVDGRPFVGHWQPARLSTQEWLRADLGAGNGAAADTAVLIDHDLSSCSPYGASWRVQYSDDASSWYDATPDVPPADDRCSLAKFPCAFPHRFWRVLVSNRGPGNFTSFPRIGQVVVGRRIEFPIGLQPGFDPQSEKPQQSAPVSSTGTFLGTAVKYVERTFDLQFEAKTGFAPAFFADDDLGLDRWWNEHAGRAGKGFFFAWDDARERPSWCRVAPGSSYAAPWGETFLNRGLKLQLQALVEA